MTARDELALLLSQVAVEAGAVVARIYAGPSRIRWKRDRSPVTDADHAAEAAILERLALRLPQLPVISEESAASGQIPPIGERFVLVDPLDGTEEFLARNDEFTINLAVIDNGKPVAGAVYAPVLQRLWLAGTGAYRVEAPPGAAVGTLAGRRPIRARPKPERGLVALVSRSHMDPETEHFLAGLPVAERRSLGSSLKFCAIAEGAADLYPRLAPTMEWDTAAGHALVAAAGGRVEAMHGTPLLYGKKASGFCNPGFVAWGAPPGAGHAG